MGSFFRCEFEGCPFYEKPQYAEIIFFKKHLVLRHGFDCLLDFAHQKGIIQDPYRCPSLSFLIERIAELSKIEQL